MRRHRYTAKRPLMGEINVVPYIDVMLVLLVIFMITAPLLDQGVFVELPKATSAPITARAEQSFILTVAADGNYYLDSETAVSLEQIAQRVRALLQQDPQQAFFVRGDATVRYAAIVQAMVVLQQAGATAVNLVTESPQQ